VRLGKYAAKRRFNETPEPRGTVKKRTHNKKLAFVVQEHHASRLHYDFRLELDGVLKSWAVPKGPSMNPHDKHLAVHVEDHPLEYRHFEGVIPEGNYGAGNVIIWDQGTYEPYHDNPDDQATLREEYKKGHLTFFLHGEKLKGEFALIKANHMGDNAWLLVKKGDKFATTKDIKQEDRSVVSGKKVDDNKPTRVKSDFFSYPKIAHPWTVKPMLCTLVDEPFDGDEWLFEMKWDGFRAIGVHHQDNVTLSSRTNKQDFTDHYPPVAEALRRIEHDVIVDGEIIASDVHDVPHFELLQNWRHDPVGRLQYCVFDLLWIDGHDVRDMPLIERKALLQSIIPDDSIIRFSDHVVGRGKALFHEVQKRNLEGIVAKKANSPYRENNRGNAWLKIKTHLRQEVVIGGFTEPKGSREYLGSLLVGVYQDGKLHYVGHSGGGIPDKQRQLLREKLDHIERKTSPFSTTPKPNGEVHWVKPELVCEMSFSEWTSDGSMRHPAYEGLRPDKNPRSVHKEKEKHVNAKTAAKKPTHTEFTHLDKVFFPKHHYTKGDVVSYYESIAPFILPYLRDRPLSLLRQPDGITGEAFFQKNMEHLPDWVPSVDIFSESNQKDLHWVVGGELETLRYIVQLGSIEINPWNSRIQHLDKPDWIVIDLDPEGVTFKDVVTVAREVKRVSDEWGIDCYAKTSGKTGIHIFMPLGAHYSYEQAKDFAHLFVIEVNKRQPTLTSLERLPKKRPNRIYLDFLQNRSGQTLAAPYSLRPNPDACVSTPLHWSEVNSSLKPTNFTIKNIHRRLGQVGDLWKPVIGKGIDLAAILKNVEPREQK
jgi:bifunctional non-homologous end joining protein LigD